jgi:hypothetical protein
VAGGCPSCFYVFRYIREEWGFIENIKTKEVKQILVSQICFTQKNLRSFLDKHLAHQDFIILLSSSGESLFIQKP